MSWGMVAGAAISVGGSLLNKPKTPKVQSVDINALIRQGNQQAEDNIRRSIELENQYDPQTGQLRTMTNRGLMADFEMDTSRRDGILSQLLESGQGNDPLMRGAYDATLADLQRGGSLDTEMHNDVMRGALARGGRAGIGGSAAEGGLVARDLGLTSEAVRQQRIQAAAAMGNNRLAGLSTALQGYQAVQGQDLARRTGIAGMIQARERPVAGLDPSVLANIAVGNTNTQNQAAMNNAQTKAASNQAMWNTIGGAIGQADWSKMWGNNNKAPKNTPYQSKLPADYRFGGGNPPIGSSRSLGLSPGSDNLY